MLARHLLWLSCCLSFIVSCTGLVSCTGGPSLPSLNVSPQVLLTNDRATTIGIRPSKVYERIAGPAQKCWFGPFGSLHQSYLLHADVPPRSVGTVTISVHNKTLDAKKPWGTRVLRVTLTGQSTTTLTFENVGLDRTTANQIERGMTAWANGRTSCPEQPRSPTSTR